MACYNLDTERYMSEKENPSILMKIETPQVKTMKYKILKNLISDMRRKMLGAEANNRTQGLDHTINEPDDHDLYSLPLRLLSHNW